MRLFLAPMEGLVDPPMRELITGVGGVDHCVTEFLRITNSRFPTKVYRRLVPEMANDWRTAAGIPVTLQILGSDAERMADNAARAAELGAPAVDINFGCPAKIVNRHRGGAALLEEPELLYQIVSRIRRALPEATPLSAKMRLGLNDKTRSVECAQALSQAGAAEITVHARTKTEGYRPPAYWEYLPAIREAVPVPIIANGEVWTVEDFHRCRQVSGCEDVMIGRGLIAKPDLALQIRDSLAGRPVKPWTWSQVSPLVSELFESTLEQAGPRHAPGRLKQWLTFLRLTYPEAQQLFVLIKKEKSVASLRAHLTPDPATSHLKAAG
ncbi:tRNA-dihydrouridine synthase family protein [Marinobacteraceae bacterium S3BR75-40.1]